ncbi:MAG TPA: hypothetical protein VN516_00635, partial [Candidatus Baltobacteraceae bacterium]|nr:hypothetical protein [Candidatus Baltobacteraceae bacterium]
KLVFSRENSSKKENRVKPVGIYDLGFTIYEAVKFPGVPGGFLVVGRISARFTDFKKRFFSASKNPVFREFTKSA